MGDSVGDIILDNDFSGLLPALENGEYALLEENILQNGCRDPLVLWGDILIDGYRRYEICARHGIPFNTVSMEFSSREEATIWIISTQISRRNLSGMHLSYYRGLHYNSVKKIITNAEGKNQYNEVGGQNVPQPKQHSTAISLAEKYKISYKTIIRDSKLADSIEAIGRVSAEAKKMILAGDVKIDKKELNVIYSKPEAEIAETAEKITTGEYAKEKANEAAARKSQAAVEAENSDGAILPDGIGANQPGIINVNASDIIEVVRTGGALVNQTDNTAINPSDIIETIPLNSLNKYRTDADDSYQSNSAGANYDDNANAAASGAGSRLDGIVSAAPKMNRVVYDATFETLLGIYRSEMRGIEQDADMAVIGDTLKSYISKLESLLLRI